MRIDSRRFAALAQGSNERTRTNSIRVRSLFRNQGSAACKLIEKNSVNYHQRIIILTKVSEEERLSNPPGRLPSFTFVQCHLFKLKVL